MPYILLPILFLKKLRNFFSHNFLNVGNFKKMFTILAKVLAKENMSIIRIWPIGHQSV